MRKLRAVWASLGFVALAACGSPSHSSEPDGGGGDGGLLPVTLEVLAGEIKGFGNADGVGSAARFYRPHGVAVDSAGNVYVADSNNASIRKLTPAGVVTTLAGQDGTALSIPNGVAVDDAGSVYVADGGSHTVRKVTAAGVVTTLAGTAGMSGSVDSTGADARFSGPSGVAIDGAGNVYVADTNNYTIRKITAAGVVTTLAGTAGMLGNADGTGAAARFVAPQGVAVDGAGNVYVADTGNSTIRMITPAGVVTTLAGTAGMAGSGDGTGAAARFKSPTSTAVDGAGNVYVADRDNDTIRKVTPAGVVTTLAGAVASGSTDGIGAEARFFTPTGVATDSAGNVLVADNYNNTVRKVTAAGVVTTLAGSASIGSADGTGDAARFFSPQGVAADSLGNFYVADNENATIRKITPAGVVTTLAGIAGVPGTADGTGTAARFDVPTGAAVDGAGNVYVTDWQDAIRKITPDGVVTTFAGTARSPGSSDGTGAAASFNLPSGAAVDRDGNVYVADSYNYTIRKITPAGVVTTLAGSAGNVGITDGAGTAALFSFPTDVAIDGAGNLYVADSLNYTIRKVTAAGVVTTLAGMAGITGDADGKGSDARFDNPYGVAVDSAANVYVADRRNYSIRKVTPDGVTTTVGSIPALMGIMPRDLSPEPIHLAVVGDSVIVSVTSRIDTNAIVVLRHGAQ